MELLAMLGGAVCVKCGFNDYRALQVDHIDVGGTKERRVLANSHKIVNAIRINKEKFQILCANCNWIKRDEKGECRKFE